MKRLVLAVLVGLSLSTAGFGEAKKPKKEKKEVKKEEASARKETAETKAPAKAAKSSLPPSSSAAQNVLVFDAERGKTRGKLVVSIEKSADFEKAPKLLGRYQVRATPRTEEVSKEKEPEPAAKPSAAPKSAAEPTKPEGKGEPAKAPEKAAEDKPSGDEETEK